MICLSDRVEMTELDLMNLSVWSLFIGYLMDLVG